MKFTIKEQILILKGLNCLVAAYGNDLDRKEAQDMQSIMKKLDKNSIEETENS